MLIGRKETAQAIVAPHGEIIYELIPKGKNKTKHSLAHAEILVGKSSLKHYHPEMEESYYILSGKARMLLGNETFMLQAGDAVLIPVNIVHQIFNEGNESLHFLVCCAPPWTPTATVFVENE